MGLSVEVGENMIHQLDLNGNDKVDKAIMRLQAYEPEEGYYLHSHWVCSECGAWALLDYNEQMCLSNFCPNCGADMKGADDE